MADHYFLCGQIKALESKLLTPETIDRMVNASSLEEAFKGLLELQYAEYIDEKTTPEDFTSIIDQGLFETKDMILKQTSEDSLLNFLWGEFDLSNIKRALKQKLIESQTDLSDFVENNGYSRLGTLTQEDVYRLVWEGTEIPTFALENLGQAVATAEKMFKNEAPWYAVENTLDQAFFDDLGVLSAQRNDSFFVELNRRMVVQAQEQILGRVVIIEQRAVSSDEWIHSEVGMSYDQVKDIESVDKLAELIPALKVPKQASLEALAPILEAWEKGQYHHINNFIDDEATGASNHLSVPFGYFKKRENNAHLLRFILYSKSSGLSPEEIKNSLESTL